MSGYAEVTSAVLGQVDKLVKPLSDTEMKRFASGESKVVLLSRGQQIVETSTALTLALKFLAQLSPDELRQIEQRQAKLVLLSAGQQLVEKRPALTAALKAVDRLSEAELRDIEERRAKIAVLPKDAKIVYAFDPEEVASQVVKLDDAKQVVGFLNSDSRLGPPNLKKVAAVLGIVVPPSIRAKAEIQLRIAQAAVGNGGKVALHSSGADVAVPGATGEARQHGRRVAPWDPLSAYIDNGESVLRERLSALNLERLRDIVSDYGMDPARVVMKWHDRDRLVEWIIARVRDRASKGHAFRPPPAQGPGGAMFAG